MRFDDLRQQRFGLKQRERKYDDIAFAVAQPRRRTLPIEHADARRFSRPDTFLFHLRIEREHGSARRVGVRRRDAELQLVSEVLGREAKHHTFWWPLPRIADPLATGPKHAGCTALFSNRAPELSMRGAGDEQQRVVQVGFAAAVGPS